MEMANEKITTAKIIKKRFKQFQQNHKQKFNKNNTLAKRLAIFLGQLRKKITYMHAESTLAPKHRKLLHFYNSLVGV